jgi:hypothetical protein
MRIALERSFPLPCNLPADMGALLAKLAALECKIGVEDLPLSIQSVGPEPSGEVQSTRPVFLASPLDMLKREETRSPQ